MSERDRFKVEISPDVLFQEVNGETVLLDLNSESYFGLDETATRIWQLLQEHPSLNHVLAVLSQEFDVGPERLRQDVLAHIRELASVGLIKLQE